MVHFFYLMMFFISVILLIMYASQWHRHFDVNITLVFVIICISNLGYAMLGGADNLGEAYYANKILYMGGCFLPVLMFFATVSLCHVQVPKWVRTLLLIVSFVIYLSVLTTGNTPLFYQNASFGIDHGGGYLFDKEYGIMHDVFYIVMLFYFLVNLVIAVYSHLRMNDVSDHNIRLLCLLQISTIVGFVIGRGGIRSIKSLQLIPLFFDVALVIFLVIIHRMNLYDIADTAIDTMVQKGNTGIISLDFKNRYLGSNDMAKKVLPHLKDVNVDTRISDYRGFEDTIFVWLEHFKKDEKHNGFRYEAGECIYSIEMNHLYDGKRKCGYQIFIRDNTKEQKYIDLMQQYNEDLQSEVEEKTAHIVEMHDRLILGMATMVESRDNSTGGHVRRTSDLVRMLVDEMKEDESIDLSDAFCSDVAKAAPMHDLGKIAVDDKILRKPGKFTDEEFEQMKAHAAEGARIVREILKGTDDKEFARIAENVAHFHHERWDGSGYPDHLAGEDIPLEARIMAIADVYDALVSKRVYKDRMSFEQANSIIMDGMGRHFDKALEPYYVKARPKFEQYYTDLGDQ